MSDKRKLYPIVGGGFTTLVKKALISPVYPIGVNSDFAQMQIPSVIFSELRDSIFINEIENIEMFLPSIISAELKANKTEYAETEIVSMDIPVIISAKLLGITTYIEGPEIVSMNIHTIVSASIGLPIFYNEQPEAVTLNIPTIISASLT